MERGKLAWKISVVGSGGVGKSSLISRIIYNTDKASSLKSLHKKSIKLEGKNGPLPVDLMLLEIDPARNEEKLMAGSNAVLVVVDITNPGTLKDAERYLGLVENSDSSKITKLLATKLDRKYEAKIWDDELGLLAKKYGIEFFKLSSKTGEGFDAFFDHLKLSLLDRYYAGRKESA